MHKNTKTIIILTTTIFLLVGLNTITAANTDNQTTHEINTKTHEQHKQIETHTPTQTTKKNNQNIMKTNKTQRKENNNDITTKLTIEFITDPDDEQSTPAYLITHKNTNYTIDIKLTEDQNDNPINGTIQLYLKENAQAKQITLNQTGHTQQTYTTEEIGTNEIYAEFQGYENYLPTTSDTITLDVEQYTPTLTINEINNTCYNSTITINGTLENEGEKLENKNINIYFNNNKITTTQTDKHGQYTYNYSLENIAIQDMAKISVEYESDNPDYSDAYNQSTFAIEKIKNTIHLTQMTNMTTYTTAEIRIKVTDENNKIYEKTLNATIKSQNTQEETYTNSSLTKQDDEYYLNFIPENAGNYQLTLLTPESQYYTESQKTYNFTIEKANITINVEEEYQSIVKDNVTINGSIKSEDNHPIRNAQVEITTDTQTLATIQTDEDGKFNYTQHIFQETEDDEYFTIYFRVYENQNYHGQINESAYYLSRRNTNVTLNTNSTAKINTTLEISGEVKDAYDESITPEGTITLYINNQETKNNIAITNGEYQTTITVTEDMTSQDKLVLEAFYIADNPHVYYSNENYATMTIDYEMLATIITLTSDDARVDKDVTITVTLEDENHMRLNKTITLQVTDENDQYLYNQGIQLTNGTFKITVTPQTEGILHVIASYDGEDNIYSQKTDEHQIIVRKTETKITADDLPEKVFVNDTLSITGTLYDEEDNRLKNENITVIIQQNDAILEEKIQTNNQGRYTYTLKPEQTGTINITIIHEETRKYYQNHTKIITNPQKHETTIILNQINSTYKYHDIINISGRVQEKDEQTPANGSVTLSINNKNITTTALSDGQFTIPYLVEEVGNNNNITVTFNQNNAYNTSNATLSFSTQALKTRITMDKINTTQINQTITVSIHLTDENSNRLNGSITIRINDNQETATVTNGEYRFNYTTTQTGTNTINVTYQNDGLHYQGSSHEDTFQVTRATLETKDVIITRNDRNNTITIKGQLISNNLTTSGIKATIELNNQSYTIITGDNGTFTLTTDELIPDNYTIRIKVNQTEYFNRYEEELANITVNKYTPIINIDEIPEATYSKQLHITGNITDNYNRPLGEHNVTIQVQNKQYNITTDSNGRYSLDIDNHQAGNNTLKVMVQKTQYTDSATRTVIFTANRDTANIILEDNTDITPGQNLIIRGKLINSAGNDLINKTIIIYHDNRKYETKTDDHGIFTLTIANINAGNHSINVSFQDQNHQKIELSRQINVEKLMVTLEVDDIVARVGEYITFHATLKDQYNNPVTGGNIVFKLNGRTLRSDGRFDTNTKDVLKFKVNNGIVEYTLKADLYLRHGKNISASYSGSYKYESTKSNIAQARIQLRYANINVTTSTRSVKHHQNITFTAKVRDVTPNSDKNLLDANTTIMFKINGVSIRDKQNKIIKVPVVGDVATLNYNVTTMAGITKNHDIRYYNVTAVYENPNYYPVNNRNTTVFNVERSPVNINIQQIKVNATKLIIRANLTDYKGYLVEGRNKICIKINGVTYKQNNVTKYFSIVNGQIDIDNINVGDMKVKSVEIVTGQRLAYLSARQKTTVIEY
ncbi:MAG: hypothetical protein BZ138_00425 [Methanosphaera sp. rholeuAM270]|nr:MAG: hypothetical protein BZ138_00425 [Methanosphaera sp. rholeuAM270]